MCRGIANCDANYRFYCGCRLRLSTTGLFCDVDQVPALLFGVAGRCAAGDHHVKLGCEPVGQHELHHPGPGNRSAGRTRGRGERGATPQKNKKKNRVIAE